MKNHGWPLIMAKRERKPVHHVQMTDGKRAIIQHLLQEYDIQDALKGLLGGTIKEMMEAEMDHHLGYENLNVLIQQTRYETTEMAIRRSKLIPALAAWILKFLRIVCVSLNLSSKKRQKDISDIDRKIISMFAKGLSTKQISETLMDIYGFEASEGFISDVTDKILPQIEEWQNRPLSAIYPIIFIDAIHFSVRDDSVIRKLATYAVLGINLEGKKEVLSLVIGENESSKYWLSVLNALKNRGVQDILILCFDGFTEIFRIRV